MRAIFFILLLSTLTTTGCVFDNWYWYGVCDSDQCQSLDQATDLADDLEELATQRFRQEWPHPTSLSLDQAIEAADQSIVSCGLPNDDRISEEAIPETFPDEIILNIDLFDSEDSEQQKLCRITASLVHAGAHLELPELEHQCRVEIDEVEACPQDKQIDDEILAAERSIYLTCLDQWW